MSVSQNTLLAVAKESCSAEEWQESIVYTIPDVPPGEAFAMNRRTTHFDVPVTLLFIDLEPKINWSHPCRYVVVNESGEVLQQTEGHFPPDTSHLLLLHKADNTEDWTLLTSKEAF